jgi:uncharacterized membrane protein
MQRMRIKITRLFIILLSLLFIAPTNGVYAQDNQLLQDTYYKAQIKQVIEEGSKDVNGVTIPYQIVQIKILDGNLRGKEFTIDHGTIFSIEKDKFVKPGQAVVIVRTTGPDLSPIFQIIDSYRLPTLFPFLIIFTAAVMLLSGWRGIGSIIGMIISIIVIVKFIVPQILAGNDPLTISILGSMGIMLTTIYLAHGFSRQTSIALISTFLTLLFTGGLSVLLVKATHLTGLGSEDAYSLKLGLTAIVNFKGLLLGGILIGALGVLDDVTTGLTASIFELKRANAKLSFFELFSAGLRVGREHVSSLVNTLVLAYAGASLPIFIMLITNPNNYPLWSIINSETMTEEIVRTLSGSFGLIVAVPLTTAIAAWYLTRREHK